MMRQPTRRECLAMIAGVTSSAHAPAAQAGEVGLRPLRAADGQSFDFPTVQALLHIDRYLRARTDNRRSLRVFASGQLGADDETVAQTRAGAIDITRVNAAPMSALVPACQLFSVPFIIQSDDHLRRVLSSDVGRDILAGFEAYGLVGLGFYEAGARSFFNSQHPVRGPQDLRGLRIRVEKNSLMRDLVLAIGGLPVELSYSHLGASFQAGLIDGAEDTWPSYVTTDSHLTARFLTLTQHARPPGIVLMSARTWMALDRQEKHLLREAMSESQPFLRGRMDEWTAISRQQAVAEGVDIRADFDHAAFSRAFRPVTDSLLRDPDLARIAGRIRDLA